MLSPQITALLASLGAGNPGAPMGETGQPLPAPPPPVVPGRPSAGSAAGRSPLDLIAPFLAIGTALSGNTQAATGSFEGLAQNELQRQQREQADQILQQRNQQFGLQAHAQQLQEQRLQQQDAAQQQAAEQQRQRALMAEVEHVRKLMPTFKTQQDYDTYINFAEDNLGVRRNTVRAIVPFRNEHAEKAMHEAVVAAVKQGGLDILDRPDLVIQVADVNGDGSGKSAVTLGEAMRIGNYVAVRDPSTGKLVKAPEIAKSDTRDAVEKMLDANLSQFAAQKGWKPTEKDPEWKAIYQQSLKEVSQARDLPNAAPSMAVKPLSRFQRNTLERQLRAEAEKHIAPIREMNRQVVVMRAGMAEIKRTGKLSAGTQAVINTFNRSMEPGSVTREAEYLRSTLGQSLFDSFAGRWNALTQGGPGVLEKNLADIVALSERIASETADLSKTNIDMIRGHAEEEGLPVDRVVPPEASYRLTGPTTSGSGPATGSIVTLKDGRRVRVELASLVPSFARPLLDILEWIKAHPTETGAMVGATAAVPFTGATSLLPLAAAMGLGGVGGAGAGILTGKAYGADVPDTLPGALKSMGAHGLEQSVGAVVPPAMQKAAGLVSRTSTGMVRSAIKTTVSMLRSQSAGGTAAGLSAKADALAEYIIARKLTTPEKAQAIVQETESALQAAITRAGDPVTDAPRRAQQYLGALERSANKQSLGAEDIAAIRAKAAELLRGPMGEDIPTATVVGGKKNKPRTWDIERGTTRDLRDDVRASEALSRARADSKWANNRQYGEQKTAPREASKAVERANRDAVKAAVPEAKPILGEQSRAIQSRKVLDQMAQREGNRDTLSLSGVAGAAPALAAGRIPVLGFAAQWLRNNQLKAGIHAKSLQRALVNKDAQAAASILTRLGVTIPELPEDQP